MNVRYVFVLLSFAAFGFIVVIFNIGFDTIESLQISLAVLGLLTTFGGAYLGAKVAGEYSVEVSNKSEVHKISIQNKKAEYIRSTYLKDINELLRSFREADLIGNFLEAKIYGVFTTENYKRVENAYLMRLEQLINDLNQYRFTDGFFYNDDEYIQHISNAIKFLINMEIYLKIINERIDNENNEGLKDFEEELIEWLKKWYPLIYEDEN